MRFGKHLIAATILSGLAWSSGPSDAAKLGESCGGIAGLTCEAGLLCEMRAGTCGAADAPGTCVRVPEVCSQIYTPVCACNGQTYPNDCQRQSARQSKRRDGAC